MVLAAPVLDTLGLQLSGWEATAEAQTKKRRKKKPKPEEKPPEVKPDEPTIEIAPDQPIEVEPTGPTGTETEPTGTETEPTVEIEAGAAEAALDKKDKELQLGEKLVSWQDIVVVKRRPFLKANRIELVPTIGVTLNDNMIRHYMGAARANYWFSEALGVGVEGQYFIKEFLEPYDIIGRQYRRIPTLNKYNWGAAVNFNYVPAYGKFAVFNKWIFHWEFYLTAGVGLTQSEVLPRDPALPGWTNLLITPNVGLTARVFISSFLTLDLGFRDYMFIDKFESTMRTTADVGAAQDEADSRFINHIMFTAGLSFWIPPTFDYTTFR